MADLITLDTYKQAKLISGAKEDERLSLIVPSVSQLVKTYCGNSFVDYVTTPYEEYFSLEFSQNSLYLSEIPFIAITELSERLSPLEDYQVLTEGSDFVTDRRVDSVVKIDGKWAIGPESVKVVYTAGNTSVPADLRLAVIDLITYFWKDEHKTQRQLSGASMTNAGTSTLQGNIGFPDHIKRVLDLYRQI